MSDSPILWINLEGVPLAFLHRLMVSGRMPILRDLMRDGSSVEIRASLASPLATWGEALTGAEPSRNGIGDEMNLRDSENPALLSSADLAAETLISVASRARKTTTALNFPLTAPAEELPGAFILPGGLAKRHLSRQCAPKDLIQRLKSAPGLDADSLAVNATDESDALSAWEVGERAPWIRLQSNRNRHWLIAAEWLLRNEPTDLFALNLTGLGEMLRLEGSLLKADSELPESSDFIALAEALDEGIGRLANAAGSDALLFIGSPYSLQPANAIFYLNVFLEKAGFLAWNEAAPKASRDSIPRNGPIRRAALPPFEPSGTTAFCANGASGGIRIAANPASGESKTALAERLMKAFSKIEDAPIRLLKSEDALGSPLLESAPDLYASPPEGTIFSVERSEETIRRRESAIGSASGSGWLLSSVGSGKSEARALIDLAPTLLRAMGVPIPSDWDGAPVEGLFTEEFLRRHPIAVGLESKRKGESPEVSASEESLSADEKIYERLKFLGYVE